MPNMEELKQVVFSMNPNSAPGLDGIGRKFYQVFWNFIENDLFGALQYPSVATWCLNLCHMLVWYWLLK